MVNIDIHFEEIDSSNQIVYENLAQCYEAEFSRITEKMPHEDGLFPLDTIPEGAYKGFLCYLDKTPVGFTIINTDKEIKDIAEFYVIPAMRSKGIGQQMANYSFDRYPGKWQVRQIEGADGATYFWRQVIKDYTNNQYIESKVDDPDYGIVTRQEFQTAKVPHR